MVKLTITVALGVAILCAGCGRSEAAREGRPAAGSDSAARASASDTTLNRLADRARIQGSDKATLWVVEVSDFQCPYCKGWHDETYLVIKRDYVDAGKVRLAYVNFPLPGHKNAWPAAEAAMCAGLQGKFWELHDSLFSSQERWAQSASPAAVFDSLAVGSGVRLEPFHRCIAGKQLQALIEADMERATESGVSSTPTIMIGRTVIRGAEPTEVFRRAIDSALASGGK